MAKPFDATLKDLIESYPGDWLAALDLAASGLVTVIDADLSTVTTQADKIIRVDDPEPWLLHIDLQGGAVARSARHERIEHLPGYSGGRPE